MFNRFHKRGDVGPIHHAPWSRKVRTMCFRGSRAYEVQVGCWVVQWFYDKPAPQAGHGRFHVWRDLYTNSRSYLRYAPWGVN